MYFLRKLWAILEPDQRTRALGIFALMTVGMLLETFSVGFVLPALAVMTKPELVTQLPAIIRNFLPADGVPPQSVVLLAGITALLFLYVAKAAFLLFLYWNQAKFVFFLHADLSQRLFTRYLFQPYAFHLRTNSARLIHNVVNEVNQFTNAGQAAMLLLTELLVVVGIVSLLLLIEPVAAAIVGALFGIASLIFYRAVRNRTSNWGRQKQIHDGLRVQHIQQGLGAVKDIKVLGREKEFLDQYRIHNFGNARVLQHQNFYQQVPRLFLEVIAVASLGAAVLVIVLEGRPLDALLPTLGLFGVAAFRLMPSANRILGALQIVRFCGPVVDNLYREIVQPDLPLAKDHRHKVNFGGSIVVDDVSFSYEAVDERTLRAATIDIGRGTSVGFIGPSGGGKSTLVDIILGLLTPTKGRVLVDGADIQSNLRGWQNQIGYVPQSIFLTDDTLRRNVAFGLADADIDEGAVWRAIRAARLEDVVVSLPRGLDTEVGERGVRLSGGQRQRIGIARALYHDPAVLVLDEATSSLDAATEEGVMEAIDAMHGLKTLIIVAHKLTTVERCDVLYTVKDGEVTKKKTADKTEAKRNEPAQESPAKAPS